MSNSTFLTKFNDNSYTVWFENNPSNSKIGEEPIWDFINPLTRNQCEKTFGLYGKPLSWIDIRIHDKQVLLLFQLGWEHLVKES